MDKYNQTIVDCHQICKRRIYNYKMGNFSSAAFSCLLWMLICSTAVGSSVSESFGPELCVVNTPLSTDFFSAWTEKPANSRSCFISLPTGKSTNEVHIIRLSKLGDLSSKDVTLELANANASNRITSRLILVLDSEVAVKWNIRASRIDPRLQHSIILTGNSELLQSDVAAEVTNRQKESRQSLIRFVERRYRTINSISDVESANRIRLSLGPVSGVGRCNSKNESERSTPLTEAWRASKETIDGCFHAEQTGTYPRDVHIIQVASETTENVPGDVHLHLAPDHTEANQSQDLALVLQSAHPVRWILTSAPQLKGTLLIVAEHPVENAGISDQQSIQVRSQNMDDSFAMLILSVTADIGPPLSYVKTQSANRLELIVTHKGKLGQKKEKPNHNSPSLEMGVRSLERGIITPAASKAGANRGVTSMLQQALQVQCDVNHMTASLPRVVSEVLGVAAVWFNDRSCSGKRNDTHWFLRTSASACSSVTKMSGKSTTYSNVVHVQLSSVEQNDDEDFEGSGFESYASPLTSVRHVGIPVECHYKPELPLGGSKQTDDDDVMNAMQLPTDHLELYHMEIYRNKGLTIAVAGDSSQGHSAAEVVFDETLHVRTWIDGVAYIRIVMEKCWVSNSSDSNHPARLVLIRNTCPAHLSVQVNQRPDATDNGFSFHVSKDYADLGQLYIHCKLGLCANDQSKVQGNLKLCVEHSQYCAGRHVLKPFLEESISAAQQILVRGPLRMVRKLSHLLESTDSPNGNQNGLPSTQVIIVGVSTEVTVGIALASFVIGVGLTAILWCIHMKTGMKKKIHTDGLAVQKLERSPPTDAQA